MNTQQKPQKSFFISNSNRHGFTLIEVLVTISILITLAAIIFSVAQRTKKAALKANEISAARDLVAMYQSAAAEDNGRFLPGYDRTVKEVILKNGEVVGGPTVARYPYRLAAKMDLPIDHIALRGVNRNQIDAQDHYTVSLFPTFGINYYFLGGDVQTDGSVSYDADCVKTNCQAAGSMIAFASSGSFGAKQSTIEGYATIGPPHLTGVMWDSKAWSKKSDPAKYGHLHPRWDQKATVAFIDGSIRLLTIEELRDMRLWSSQAVIKNDPNYFIPRDGRGGRL